MAKAAALLTALAAVLSCNEATDSEPDIVAATGTIAGESVTDLRALAVTPEELEEYRQSCKEGAGVPGTSDECQGLNSPNIVAPEECTKRLCIYVGTLADQPQEAILEVRDRRDDEDVCAERPELCAVTSFVIADPASPTGSPSPSPSPTATPSTSPSPSATESTAVASVSPTTEAT